MADSPASSGVRDALRALRAGHRIVRDATPGERLAVVEDIATIVEAVTGGIRREDQRADLLDALAGVAAEMEAEYRRWSTDPDEGDGPEEDPEHTEAEASDREQVERARARVDAAIGGSDG